MPLNDKEQADGKRIGPGTDIFALGAIFYDMLTGQPPCYQRHARNFLPTTLRCPKHG